MHLSIGVDVGNYDTKTQHTVTPSGYSVNSTKPLLEKQPLFYNGLYYTPSRKRIEYAKDKTENDQCLILTLLGIAKEVEWAAKENASHSVDNVSTTERLQSFVNGITSVSIGVGLPVGDFSALEPKTKAYYQDKFARGIYFKYGDVEYQLPFRSLKVFPQDVLPVCANPDCEIAMEYPKYVIIGVGGQTVDIIPIVDGSPDVERCTSSRRGIRNMFSEIIDRLDAAYGVTVEEGTINDVLLGRKTPLPDNICDTIRDEARKRANELLGICATKNISYMEYPVVFFGGGALLLRPFLEENKQLITYRFVEDINGNAKSYADFLEEE